MLQNQGFSKVLAWRRFGARVIDMWLYLFFSLAICVLIIFLMVLLGGDIGEQFAKNLGEFLEKRSKLAGIVLNFLTCSIILPISFHFFGSTFGKKLFGVVIANRDGNSLSFKEAQEREINVFFKGLFFLWFSMMYQYYAFKRNKILSWDENLNLSVSYKEFSNLSLCLRSFFAVIIIFSLIFLYAYVSYVDI
jgi:hypothetical protein